MAKVQIYQGEAKTLPFRIKDRQTGRVLDLTGATFLLWVKRSPENAEPVFTKVDADFNKAAAASGYVSTFLTAYDTFQEPWNYQGELRVTKAADPDGNIGVEKLVFDLEILPSATPNDWILQPAGIGSLEALGTPVVSNL